MLPPNLFKFLTLAILLIGWKQRETKSSVDGPKDQLKVERVGDGPIISPATDPTGGIGTNINGPSIIRVPRWVTKPLGAYYLYFADHNGKYIRLAYADSVRGPWKIYAPGTLALKDSWFTNHIASPCAVVDESTKQIRLYYHGLTPEEAAQHTRVALSADGLNFKAVKAPVGAGSAYWKLFKYDGWWYALAMPGKLYRSRDGLTPFEEGPQLFERSQVHNGLLIHGMQLLVFYTRTGDSPERILSSTVALSNNWLIWKPTAAQLALMPEKQFEGADLPVTQTVIGALDHRVRGLRDPELFEDGNRAYMLYCIAGESGIALAEVTGFPR